MSRRLGSPAWLAEASTKAAASAKADTVASPRHVDHDALIVSLAVRRTKDFAPSRHAGLARRSFSEGGSFSAGGTYIPGSSNREGGILIPSHNGLHK